MFKLYLQIFTGVQCGFLLSRGRCLICEPFLTKFYKSCPYLWSQPLLLPLHIFLPNSQKEVEQKRCLQRIPTQKNPGVLNRVTVVDKLSIHHVQSKQPSCDWGKSNLAMEVRGCSILLKNEISVHILWYFVLNSLGTEVGDCDSWSDTQ